MCGTLARPMIKSLMLGRVPTAQGAGQIEAAVIASRP